MKEFYAIDLDGSSKAPLTKGEYEECSFIGVDLSNQDLSAFKFISCSFRDCNLSNCRLSNTSLQDCQFQKSKMLGINWDDCNSFNLSIRFFDCLLNHSSFYQINLCNSSFDSCSLQDVDFTGADLHHSKILNCDLLNAQFEQTNLESTDLKGSCNFRIDPEINNVTNALFSSDQLVGLLMKYQIRITDH